jgi:TATA-binding protein-associated factor
VRATAAAQIGELARRHPSEAQALLYRLRPLLHATRDAWDTRIAAAKAVEAICAALPSWPSASTDSTDTPLTDDLRALPPLQHVRLSFAEFDIGHVLARGSPLLASGGQEFDMDWGQVEPSQRVALQRKLLKQQLGLDEHVGVAMFARSHVRAMDDIAATIPDEDLVGRHR